MEDGDDIREGWDCRCWVQALESWHLNSNSSFASGNRATLASPCLGVLLCEMRVAVASSPGLWSCNKALWVKHLVQPLVASFLLQSPFWACSWKVKVPIGSEMRWAGGMGPVGLCCHSGLEGLLLGKRKGIGLKPGPLAGLGQHFSKPDEHI